jgi:hypothetical protein
MVGGLLLLLPLLLALGLGIAPEPAPQTEPSASLAAPALAAPPLKPLLASSAIGPDGLAHGPAPPPSPAPPRGNRRSSRVWTRAWAFRPDTRYNARSDARAEAAGATPVVPSGEQSGARAAGSQVVGEATPWSWFEVSARFLPSATGYLFATFELPAGLRRGVAGLLTDSPPRSPLAAARAALAASLAASYGWLLRCYEVFKPGLDL